MDDIWPVFLLPFIQLFALQTESRDQREGDDMVHHKLPAYVQNMDRLGDTELWDTNIIVFTFDWLQQRWLPFCPFLSCLLWKVFTRQSTTSVFNQSYLLDWKFLYMPDLTDSLCAANMEVLLIIYVSQWSSYMISVFGVKALTSQEVCRVLGVYRWQLSYILCQSSLLN